MLLNLEAKDDLSWVVLTAVQYETEQLSLS